MQCRDVGITHGDIGSENIVVTSWNWIQLTDFEPFKPAFLPATEPAPFDYYFDTSGRQSCYIAPERFLDRKQLDATLENRVAPAADIFSVGCVICELFRDGNAPFSFPTCLGTFARV